MREVFIWLSPLVFLLVLLRRSCAVNTAKQCVSCAEQSRKLQSRNARVTRNLWRLDQRPDGVGQRDSLLLIGSVPRFLSRRPIHTDAVKGSMKRESARISIDEFLMLEARKMPNNIRLIKTDIYVSIMYLCGGR
jgi:hypothetical protein